MRRYGGRSGIEREETFAAVRRWLAEAPAGATFDAYDDFAREYNYSLADGAAPLPRYRTIIDSLGLTWRDVVAVARGEMDHPQAHRERAEKRDWTRAPERLIGVATIGFLAGKKAGAARLLANEPYFPRPALVLANRRAWLEDEVLAYLAGERPHLREADRLRAEYMSTREVADAVGVVPMTLYHLRGQLPPLGKLLASAIGCARRSTPTSRATSS
jgi:hypothetical protein